MRVTFPYLCVCANTWKTLHTKLYITWNRALKGILKYKYRENACRESSSKHKACGWHKFTRSLDLSNMSFPTQRQNIFSKNLDTAYCIKFKCSLCIETVQVSKNKQTKNPPLQHIPFLIYQKCFQGNIIKTITPQSLTQHQALIGRYREDRKSSIGGLGALLFFAQ